MTNKTLQKIIDTDITKFTDSEYKELKGSNEFNIQFEKKEKLLALYPKNKNLPHVFMDVVDKNGIQYVIKSKKWLNVDNNLSRDDFPAEIEYFTNGIIIKRWYQDGIPKRKGKKPIVVNIGEGGTVFEWEVDKTIPAIQKESIALDYRANLLLLSYFVPDELGFVPCLWIASLSNYKEVTKIYFKRRKEITTSEFKRALEIFEMFNISYRKLNGTNDFPEGFKDLLQFNICGNN